MLYKRLVTKREAIVLDYCLKAEREKERRRARLKAERGQHSALPLLLDYAMPGRW